MAWRGRPWGSTAAVWDQDGRQRNSHPPQRYIRERLWKEYDVTDMTL